MGQGVPILPLAGYLRRGGEDEAEVNKDLKKVGGILGRAQGAQQLHPQHPGLVALGEEGQENVGKLEDIEHHRVFQQAPMLPALPFFHQVHGAPHDPLTRNASAAAPYHRRSTSHRAIF